MVLGHTSVALRGGVASSNGVASAGVRLAVWEERQGGGGCLDAVTTSLGYLGRLGGRDWFFFV